MVDNRPDSIEVMRKFIISAAYGTSGAFPYGPKSTVVISHISCTSQDKKTEKMVHICRNEGRGQHAEIKLIEFLKQNDKVEKADEVNIHMLQNFSPCNDDAGLTFCAEKIIKYQDDMEREGKRMNITITFANFYRTTVYDRVYNGNDEKRAEENKGGLGKLNGAGVTLRLLQGEEQWKEFLYDEELVKLSDKEKKLLLAEATSKDRSEREKFDRNHLSEILSKKDEDQGVPLALDKL